MAMDLPHRIQRHLGLPVTVLGVAQEIGDVMWARPRRARGSPAGRLELPYARVPTRPYSCHSALSAF